MQPTPFPYTASNDNIGEETPPVSCSSRHPPLSTGKRQSSDTCINGCRGIPLHRRLTCSNKVLIETFCKLVFEQVLTSLQIRLDADVISTIVLYTFERTHPFVPHTRLEVRQSLMREEEILDILRPCEQDFEPNPSEDFTLETLIGRTLYGFDIHDSPYAGVDDPNPCEIMTKEGGIFLVPSRLSDWFLNQDGKCIPLPVRYRFKHRITDAKVMSRATGPWLQLTILPIRKVVPGTDELLMTSAFDSLEYSDEESFSSYDISDIDVTLNHPSHERNNTDDTLAAEIVNSWKSPRESMLVVVSPSLPPEVPLCDTEDCNFDEPNLHDQEEPDLTLSLSENESLELLLEPYPSTDINKRIEDEKEEQDEDLIASQYLIEKRIVQKSSTARPLVSSFTTTEYGTPCTSLGSVALINTPLEELTLGGEEDEEHTNLGCNLRRRPSIIKHKSPKACVLELGAGFVGIQDLSLSFLHGKVTPNPHTRDASLDSIEFEIDL